MGVINAYSKSRRDDAPKQALAILEGMISAYKMTNNDKIRPDVITYTAVIDAHARRGDYEGAMKVFMMQANDYKKEDNIFAKPNIITFNTMINACSKSDRDDIPETAEQILTIIDVWHGRKDLQEGPNTITYSGVINCWSKSNRPEAPSRALAILETMIAKYKVDGINDVRPNTITYNSVMDAYARQGDIDGAKKVFMMMKEDYGSGNQNALQNLLTYNILLNAWANSRNENAPVEVEKILKEINDCHNSGKLKEGPDKIIYSKMIRCLELYPGTEERIQELKMSMRIF